MALPEPPVIPGRMARGAAVLGIAAVISKLLGTAQKIPLQNIAGDGVFGIYNAVYPLYLLILTLATAGLPIAVSKFVSDDFAAGRPEQARRVLRLASAVLFASALVFFVLLYFGAGTLAGWIGASQAETAIRAVSFALLIVPVLAALRGYFQGRHDMLPTAVSQVVEQFVRVAAMIALLLYFTARGWPEDWIAAGATFGSAVGAGAALAALLMYDRRERIRRGTRTGDKPASAPREQLEPASRLMLRFVRYALPVCLASIVLPILTLADTFTVPRLLLTYGRSEPEALAAFGIYNHGLPLVQLAGLIAGSMSAALVPAIAEARRLGQFAAIRSQTELSIRLTWLVGLAASFGLAAAALPIHVMFYRTAQGTGTMTILAFSAVFATLNIVTAAILTGFGSVRAPAVHMLIAAAVKIAGNFALMPRWGIDGAAVSAVLAYAAAGLLNLRHLRACTQVGFTARRYVYRPAAAIAAMCAAVLALRYCTQAALEALYGGVPGRLGYTLVALAAVGGGGLAFAAALVKFGAVSRGELQAVPGFGPDGKGERVLLKLRLLK